jgi:hypothetical protein
MTSLVYGALGAVLLLIAATPLSGQGRETRMLITVVDQTNAVIPGATVNVIGTEPATQKTELPPAKTSDAGLATVGGLTPGRYTARAEFAGFHPGVLKEVRIRPGDNRHIIVLLIENFQDSINVAQDAQAGAADRRGDAFGTVLTREAMDALSDDPDEMQRQLEAMAGPGAVIRIDSFEGGQLPPKSQIKSIRVTRDQFAAENHSADSFFVEIITQPGLGPIRTTFNYNLRNSAMSARNAFTPTKGAEQEQYYGFNAGGGLIQNKASFQLRIGGGSSFDTPNSSIGRATGTQIRTLLLRMPRENLAAYGAFDYAVTRDQTLRFSFNRQGNTAKNQGIGGYDEPERAYRTDNHNNTFRAQEVGPLGRRFFINSRLNIGWTDSNSQSVLEAPTIRVLDAQTQGGAQRAGGRHSRDVNFASDLDYVRGIHSVRVGTAIDGNWYRSDETQNYLGTYTFESIEAFEQHTPRSYTRRVGDPNVAYSNIQAALYIQDDIRVRRGFSLTPGVRFEAQTHMNDRNVGPRLGTTWAPFKNGKTTVRASWGIFYDWLLTNTYEQTLRVDGFRQQEMDIPNPSYPNPPAEISALTPVNRYVLDPALEHPRNSRVSSGVDYAFTPRMRANITYRYIRGAGILRGENLNAPVNGIRPLPQFGNVVQVVSDGRSRQHVLNITGQTNPPQQQGREDKRWDFKRINFYFDYSLIHNRNNSDGPFSTPATGSLENEWGRAAFASRHRLFAGFNSSALRNVMVQFYGRYASGNPYTIQTGYDDNGDLIFNDRPAGVARNTAETPANWNIGSYIGYTFTFGPPIQLPTGVQIFGGGGNINVNSYTPPSQGRYRMQFNLSIDNLTNHANLTGYSGIMTSPFFRQPTRAEGARRIRVGTNLTF